MVLRNGGTHCPPVRLFGLSPAPSRRKASEVFRLIGNVNLRTSRARIQRKISQCMGSGPPGDRLATGQVFNLRLPSIFPTLKTSLEFHRNVSGTEPTSLPCQAGVCPGGLKRRHGSDGGRTQNCSVRAPSVIAAGEGSFIDGLTCGDTPEFGRQNDSQQGWLLPDCHWESIIQRPSRNSGDANQSVCTTPGVAWESVAAVGSCCHRASTGGGSVRKNFPLTPFFAQIAEELVFG